MSPFNFARWLVAVPLFAACGVGTGTSDGSPPFVAIVSPTAGATVGKQVAIDVDASDDFGVQRVRILIDGTPLIEVFRPPYHAVWNANALASGTTHVIRAEAYDASNNISTAQITVMVVNGPQ
ncbi:MAG: Ig-like domain-containing protein [Gemmatimonadales bacterium]|nr:Ig-like domain-containing protein [Gemmatimonadales bacterium]